MKFALLFALMIINAIGLIFILSLVATAGIIFKAKGFIPGLLSSRKQINRGLL
jgi:hypothetical protein